MSMFRRTLALAIGAVTLTAGLGLADSPRDRATGGGQTLVDTRGAGNTIAFTAQNRAGGAADAATGNLTYVDRSAGTGQAQEVFHGDVLCLRVSGNTAKLAGQFRDGSPFELVVVDNGEGANADNDLVLLQKEDTDPTCAEDDDDDDNPLVALARGNAQVHDAA